MDPRLDSAEDECISLGDEEEKIKQKKKVQIEE